MGVLITAGADVPWLEPSEAWPGRAREGEPSLTYKPLMPRKPGLPNVSRIRYAPDHFEPPHSHTEDEVFYIVAGEMALGTRTLVGGDTIYIGRDTRYSARAGAEGCEFVRVGLPL